MARTLFIALPLLFVGVAIEANAFEDTFIDGLTKDTKLMTAGSSFCSGHGESNGMIIQALVRHSFNSSGIYTAGELLLTYAPTGSPVTPLVAPMTCSYVMDSGNTSKFAITSSGVGYAVHYWVQGGDQNCGMNDPAPTQRVQLKFINQYERPGYNNARNASGYNFVGSLVQSVIDVDTPTGFPTSFECKPGR